MSPAAWKGGLLALSLVLATPGLALAQEAAPPASPSPAAPSPRPANLADDPLLPVRPRGPATLSGPEAEATFNALQLAKPNVSTAGVLGFLFPGTPQAMMGSLDRTFLLWGLYLAGFAGAKLFIPDTNLVGGQRLNDVIVGGLFLGMASFSAVDAYLLAMGRRVTYDRLQDRLVEGQAPVLPGRPRP